METLDYFTVFKGKCFIRSFKASIFNILSAVTVGRKDHVARADEMSHCRMGSSGFADSKGGQAGKLRPRLRQKLLFNLSFVKLCFKTLKNQRMPLTVINLVHISLN